MKNKFSKEEIVELILNFYLSPMGYKMAYVIIILKVKDI